MMKFMRFMKRNLKILVVVLLMAATSCSFTTKKFDDPNKGMHRTHFLAKSLVEKLGQDLTAWVVLQGECKFWMTKCQCAQIQGVKQSQLGLGWSNNLYHVFRSSRALFPMLVRLFETLGFTIQGRCHAGVNEEWAVIFLSNFQKWEIWVHHKYLHN